ncbi:MAG: SUMF1/EgtB/PvdO family nonheme iron enzyme [Anaerolineales bacterium]|nr:SUMF1/EgtB/PvdO family nonheme iron enzyme [Anaerolineales bacterium]
MNFKFCCEGKTTAVNNYTNGISYYGAFDMSGNAREWVADWCSRTLL